MLGESFHGLGHVFVVVGLPHTNRDHRLELFVFTQKVALQLHRRDHKPIAFGDVDGQLHLALVGRYRHLGGVDPKLQKPTGQVIRTQGLQIGVELGARITVGFGIPTQPAARVQVEQVTQSALGKSLRSDDANRFNLRDIAFNDAEVQVDSVALGGRHGGHHLRCIHAAVEVLPLELLFGPVGQRFVERTAFGQTNVTQSLLQDLGVKLFDTRKSDIRHTGALLQGDDQHITFNLQTHIGKQTQTKQRANGRGAFVVGERVSNTKGQRCKDCPWFNALQTFNADVFQGKRLDRPRWQGHQCAHQPRGAPSSAKGVVLKFHAVLLSPKDGPRH